MKLKTKIQLFTTVFMFILILFVNTSIYFLFYKTAAESELNELYDQTTKIVETLQSNPDIAENELLDAFLPTNGMIRVIQSNDETIINTLTKDNDYTNLPKKYSTKESQQIIKQPDQSNVAVIEKPIIWDNGDIVTLQVSEHLVSLKDTMQILFYVLLIATILVLIPTIIAGNILSRFLLRPIQTFIQTMKKNTQAENWEKIETTNRSKDELYQMEMTFNEMIEHLKSNFDKQEQFVSNASHELKTPISIIKSYSQFLKRHGEKRPEVIPEAIEAIDSETDRMQLLIEQMLELAKNRHKTTFKRTKVDIVKLCQSIQKIFTEASTRNIILKYPHKPIFIQSNKERLKQVIYILVDNGLKYSDEDIHITFTKDEETVSINITDFGVGIPLDEQAHLFDRFYRIDKARSRNTGGSGLGLAIAKSIINEQGGTISVVSDVGKGTTFTIKLALSQ